MKPTYLLFALLMAAIAAYSQESPKGKKDTVTENKAGENEKISFSIGGEFRSRFELRNGYRTLAPDDTSVAFFGNMRTRLNLDFKSKWVNAYISLQDAREYGEYSAQFKNGTVGLFEGYAEVPIVKGFSVKVGRQRIIFDNQRLFAENNWRVWARSHDAVKFSYKNDKTQADAIIAFNQNAENNFGTLFTPTSSFANDDYKLLSAFAIKQTLGKGFSFFILHAGDAFESAIADEKKKLKLRLTDGGRIEWQDKSIYLTTSGYIQYGKTPNDQEILSWYVQPEIKLTAVKKTTFRLGAEVFSGQRAGDTLNNPKYKSFVPLYGVAHRFNGAMDHFTRFPADVKNRGLINPYLFIDFKLNDKIAFREQAHWFFTQHNLYGKTGKLSKNLGFESDLLFNYNPNKIVGLEAGYCFYIPTKSEEFLKGVDTHKFNQWAYIQLSVKTDFWKFSK